MFRKGQYLTHKSGKIEPRFHCFMFMKPENRLVLDF